MNNLSYYILRVNEDDTSDELYHFSDKASAYTTFSKIIATAQYTPNTVKLVEHLGDNYHRTLGWVAC